MKLNEIKFLADLMEERGLTSLEIEEGERSIRMQRQQTCFEPLPVPTVNVPTPMPTASKKEPEAAEGSVVDFNGVTELKSPMVGTVYVSPTPGSEPYVKAGDKVKKGQVLCIIEAMKLMNEYTAPQDGEIVDVCIHDGELVEYGQCLFKLY